MRIPKTVKRTLLSIVVMVVIFVIAAVIYVFVTGRQATKPPAKPAAKADVTNGLPKPQTPAANERESVALQTIESPVKAGDNTSISIQALAGSTCSILVIYSNGATSHDSGLTNRKADAYGFVTWTWTVEPTVPPGTYPVSVTCVYNGRSAVAVDHLVVTAS